MVALKKPASKKKFKRSKQLPRRQGHKQRRMLRKMNPSPNRRPRRRPRGSNRPPPSSRLSSSSLLSRHWTV
ncbi:hypothetical protein PSHT_01482 [Puccinia striiformis]|uniref:Uncharacterized protein n=2 Tax=Puccinia striiformis TaxID=27350 RepID=A0A2S4WKC0_9BASI|nr:hypothetical protein PSTT_14879 [Puccinia striiformis]POW22236.1 hypothetical protein PSHT_01482 [Puccinia striiformis]